MNVTYAGNPASIIVLKNQENYLADKNLCVHMPRELDCEKNTIFDETGKRLRCSMHGIVYDTNTGESLSTMCNGDKLTAIRLIEDEGNLWIKDKKVRMTDDNKK